MLNYLSCSILILFCCIHIGIAATEPPFKISLQPVQVDSMPALHSGVYIESDGKWLLIGGRTNGLHGFQGLILFPEYTQNTSIYVIDPVQRKLWSTHTEQLPISIREHITSSNMQWVTSNGMLHIIGGYGFSAVRDSFLTFPYRTSVNIKNLVSAVINSSSISTLFSQEYDIRYAVCGAHADDITTPGAFHLLFGHRFDGVYNKQDNGTGFSQTYTNAISTFTLDTQTNKISSWRQTNDSIHYHRRDYALSQGYSFITQQPFVTVFSGVFTPKTNSVFTSCIDVHKDSIRNRTEFEQKFSHYHCATVTLLDTNRKRNHTLFMGGMARYYADSLTKLPVLDTNIPFVRTISCVTREGNGTLSESVIGMMPTLEGTNSYFFPAQSPFPKMPLLVENTRRLIGYMYGGILSPKPNISQEDAAISTASSRIYEVWVDTRLSSIPATDTHQDALVVNAYQRTSTGECNVRIDSKHAETATLLITSSSGTELCRKSIELTEGTTTFALHATEFPATGVYFITLITQRSRATAKLIHLK